MMPAQTGVSVAVVGSANLDLVARTASLPVAGQTVLAEGYAEYPGGKGLNQAVAAARTVSTALIAALGEDDAGSVLRDAISARGVGSDGLMTVDAPSGRAMIAVDSSGENLIVVVPGANSVLSAEHVMVSLRRLEPSVVLAQSEVPIAAVQAAAEWCTATGARFTWNASPVGELPAELLAICDPLIVNVGEALAICTALGRRVTGVRELLVELGRSCRSVVVTAGARGVFLADGTQLSEVAAPQAAVADTTGAGDELAGSIVAGLAGGATLDAACRSAATAAAKLIGTPRADR